MFGGIFIIAIKVSSYQKGWKMTATEAKLITLNVIKDEDEAYRNKQKELIEQYTKIAESFIKDASARGSSNTGVCHSYDDPFDRKGNELYGVALEVVAMRLRNDGFNAYYYNNRAINTMGISIDWREKK